MSDLKGTCITIDLGESMRFEGFNRSKFRWIDIQYERSVIQRWIHRQNFDMHRDPVLNKCIESLHVERLYVISVRIS